MKPVQTNISGSAVVDTAGRSRDFKNHKRHIVVAEVVVKQEPHNVAMAESGNQSKMTLNMSELLILGDAEANNFRELMAKQRLEREGPDDTTLDEALDEQNEEEGPTE